MDQVFKFLSAISSFFYVLLPFMFVAVIVLGVMLLLQLAKFGKKLEFTQLKADNLNAKVERMEHSLSGLLSTPEMMKASSYRDLQFKSLMARSALDFTLDNSEDIIKWSNKAVSGYKKFKKKRNK